MKKIMVVDDEATLRITVRTLLESNGYLVSEAIDADDCWDKIQKEKPNLILLDIRMPGMKAHDLIKKIKEDMRLRDIKIVYMTAVIGTKKLTKKIEGVVDAIEKPFKNEDLINVVKEALSHVVL